MRSADSVVLIKYLSPPACGAPAIDTKAAPDPRGTFRALLPANACGLISGNTVAELTANFAPLASLANISEMQFISVASAQIGKTAR